MSTSDAKPSDQTTIFPLPIRGTWLVLAGVALIFGVAKAGEPDVGLIAGSAFLMGLLL